MELLSGYTTPEILLLSCGVGGTFFFVLRVAAAALGDIGSDFVGDAHDIAHSHDLTHSEIAFKLLSFNTISAFLMMFGWSGLAFLREGGLSLIPSLALAFSIGSASMFLVGYLFVWMLKLTSPGAEFSLDQLVGRTASVYQKILPGSKGIIQVTIGDMLREYEAESDEELEAFSSVVVVEVHPNKVVRVRRFTVSNEQAE